MNESEAGVDLVLIETSLLFLCKLLLISMTTTDIINIREAGRSVTRSLTPASISFKGQVTKPAHNCKEVYSSIRKYFMVSQGNNNLLKASQFKILGKY